MFLLLILIFVWIPNFSLLAQIFVSPNIGIGQKITFLFNGISALKTNFTLFSAAITVLISVFSAINLSLAFFISSVKSGLRNPFLVLAEF